MNRLIVTILLILTVTILLSGCSDRRAIEAIYYVYGKEYRIKPIPNNAYWFILQDKEDHNKIYWVRCYGEMGVDGYSEASLRLIPIFKDGDYIDKKEH